MKTFQSIGKPRKPKDPPKQKIGYQIKKRKAGDENFPINWKAKKTQRPPKQKIRRRQ